MFKQFDTDSSGFITLENITEAMHKFGVRITAQEIHEIMRNHAVENPK